MYESNKQRVATGLVMAAFASGIAILDNLLVTWAILGLIYLIAFHESMLLFGVEDNKFYVYALILWLFAYIHPSPHDLAYIVLILILSVMAYKKRNDYKLLAPFLYPTISMLSLYTLYTNFGMKALVWLVFVVALSDTGAYFVGKSIGKTPFSETSPNKTLEGLAGGVAAGTLAGVFLGAFSVSLSLALLISLLVSIASVFGDLFESYLKREAGVKDSGTIFPGHGGMLDRLDGYLFAGVVMIVLLRGFA